MKKGMNPEAVEQMATQITDTADQANQLFNQARQALEGLDWTGEDHDTYFAAFEDLAQLVQDMVRQAGEFAERATSNAAAQRTASA